MFFKTKETVPEGVGFSTFGVTHLIWLLCLFALIILGVFVYRKLDKKNRNLMRIILGSYIVFQEFLKDIVAAFVGDFGVGHLPFHLCGISILLIGFDVIKSTSAVRNFLYYIGIPGAMLALLFPNWTALPCMNFFNLHSFTIHALIVLYPMLLVGSGEVRPSVKVMPKCVLLLLGLAIPIYFINLLCDTNFMFLMEPETGNPLGLFEKYLGNHLWGFPILLPIVMFFMYLPMFLVSKFKKKTEVIEEEKEEITV